MDKLDKETWEDYAFRNNLYKIQYSYKDINVIDNIIIPTYDDDGYRMTSKQYLDNFFYYFGYSQPSFYVFIMYELHNLKTYYNGKRYNDMIILSSEMIEKGGKNLLTPENMSEQFDKDEKRQKWLLKELEFWGKQYKYEEGIKINLNILNYQKEKQKREDNKKRISELKANISETHKEQLEEIFNRIRENIKDIETQIIELEQKLNNLKSEII